MEDLIGLAYYGAFPLVLVFTVALLAVFAKPWVGGIFMLAALVGVVMLPFVVLLLDLPATEQSENWSTADFGHFYGKGLWTEILFWGFFNIVTSGIALGIALVIWVVAVVVRSERSRRPPVGWNAQPGHPYPYPYAGPPPMPPQPPGPGPSGVHR